MKVKIRNGNQRLWIPIPNGLLLSAPAIKLIQLAIPPNFGISKEQIVQLLREIKRCRRQLYGLPLVEVHGSDGSHIKITL